MPFLHESSNGSSVTITPTSTNGLGIPESLSKFKQEHLSSKSFSGSVAAGAKFHKSRNSVPTVAELQRKTAQRKLQMAKMIGHQMGAPSGVDFRKGQGHHQNNMMGMGDYHNDLQVASRRARSNNFTLNETFALLKIWASPEMQWQMKHNFRNFRVWEAISYAMQELGHDRTAIQCKNRIQNLTSIFYRIKKSKQDYRSFNFPYFKIIGDVLDGKKNGSNATMPPNMSEFIQHFTNASGIVNDGSPTHSGSSSGMAAHMALVEEYQHLINGNPEVTLTSTSSSAERNSPTNGSSMSVLSPEVSISEGDSPVRVDQKSNGGTQKTGSNNSNKNMNGAVVSSSSGIKSDSEECPMLDDGSIPSENDHEASDFDDSNMYNAEEEAIAILSRSDNFRGKRSLPPGLSAFSKLGYPSKRPRGLSSATTTSTGTQEDPVGHYLSEMVEIEKQWLDMERDRAENERQMMMYMMQILQALVCPGQEDQENDDGHSEGNDNEGAENEYAADNDNDEDNEIRQMIEEDTEEQ